MITGIPPYASPAYVDLRCVCARLYIVFTGEGLNGRAVDVAMSFAQERANEQECRWTQRSEREPFGTQK